MNELRWWALQAPKYLRIRRHISRSIQGCLRLLTVEHKPVLCRALSTQSTSNSTTETKRNPASPDEEMTKFDADSYRKEERDRLARYYSLLIASLVGIVGSSYLLYKRGAFALTQGKDDNERGEEIDDGKGENDHEPSEGVELHKSKAGFRERKIIEYENRLRAYSTPDKVFRYFATLQDGNTTDIYMTPEDFVRSLTRDTMQPKGLGLDEFKKFDKRKLEPYVSPLFGEDSVFLSLGESGLISFSDYIFLLTVLGTSARHIDIAFRMFDLNGDGEVTAEEFRKVRTLFLSMTTTGMRHRDHKTTGNVLADDVNSGLMHSFFGSEGDRKLTADEFVAFKQRLQKEVMQLEFNSYSAKNGRISEVNFSEILLTYASFSEKTKAKMVKRIKKCFPKGSSEGISFEDYLSFFDFLLNIRDVDMALSFHTVAGQAVDPETFKQVAQTVAGVKLRDHLVDVVFKLFDENDDGQLSNKEFVSVMKDKLCRGLNKPKDTGLTRFIGAIFTCAGNHIPDLWTSPDE